ncbi:unnamed protein product [Effrenium voratum]|uniref:Protein-serine/threonine phosphatase n=1 Tax=Effrenium voratum TaxID=2562239 RepID=A0AA36J9N4_9DINO|nr:unnamed protein product [Effrenium voratum]CAJ1459964.1 unnamed protein product [Effrenium voratum]
MPAKLIFTVLSKTTLGTTTKIVGSDPTMGGWNLEKAVPLKTDASTYPLWVGEVELNTMDGQRLDYKFVKVHPDGCVEWEPGSNRSLCFEKGEMLGTVGPVGQCNSVFGVMDGSGPRLVASEASPKTSQTLAVPMAKEASCSPTPGSEADLYFKVVCSTTGLGDYVAVVGSTQELGYWDTGKGVQLRTSANEFPTWTGVVRMDAAKCCEVEFKLLVVRSRLNVEWEEMQNRRLCKEGEGTWEVSLSYNKPGHVVNLKPVVPATWPRLLGQAQVDDTTKVEDDSSPDLDLPLNPQRVLMDEDPFRAIPHEALEATFKTKVIGHMRSLSAQGQTFGEESARITFGAIRLDPPPLISSWKGLKGRMDTSPNQDAFSVTQFKSGHTLVCVFDGHGAFGEIASTRAVQTLPFFLIKEGNFGHDTIDESDVERALMNAFEKAQQDVVAHSLENGWDSRTSGCTAVAALFKGNRIWTANLGDSRCIVGSEVDKQLVFATEDHSPDNEPEKARIESLGGEVRSRRIFVKGTNGPGLSVCRALGDQLLKPYGVCATPVIEQTTVDLPKKAFLILATDGLWQFLDSNCVVGNVAKLLPEVGPAETLHRLQKAAVRQWRNADGNYCDDITTVLLQLQGR